MMKMRLRLFMKKEKKIIIKIINFTLIKIINFIDSKKSIFNIFVMKSINKKYS